MKTSATSRGQEALTFEACFGRDRDWLLREEGLTRPGRGELLAATGGSLRSEGVSL